jgi:iron complex outermembrane receptor protein
LKELTQTGFSQNYSVAFSGGNETGRFRAAFLASRIPGFIKKNRLE